MRSIVTDRVGWSVGLSVTLVSPAKTAEPIEMPIGLRTRVGSENHVLDGGPSFPWEWAIFWGCPIVKYRDTLRSSVQKRLNRSSCGSVVGSDMSKDRKLDGIQILTGRGNFR